MRGAEMNTALGSVRSGLSISPPIEGASSSPANAKAIDAQRFKELRSVKSGTKSRAWNVFALGSPFMTAHAPNTTRSTPGMYVPMPPTFCSQRPVDRPTMLSHTASHRAPSVTDSTYGQLDPRLPPPCPNAYV